MIVVIQKKEEEVFTWSHCLQVKEGLRATFTDPIRKRNICVYTVINVCVNTVLMFAGTKRVEAPPMHRHGRQNRCMCSPCLSVCRFKEGSRPHTDSLTDVVGGTDAGDAAAGTATTHTACGHCAHQAAAGGSGWQ